MRERMIKIWRFITKIKCLRPVIVLIRWTASTKLFNDILDMTEVCILKKQYEESEQYFHSRIAEIRNNISFLEDGKSKAVYENMLRYRMTHKRKYLKGIVDKGQYFDKEIVSTDIKGVFADCGAYRGDTVKQFIKRCKNPKKTEIVCLEPDPYNFKYLKRITERLNEKGMRVKIYQKGAWSSNCRLKFSGNLEEAGAISDEGDTEISCATLDQLIKKEVSFIKMDIEGAEMEALFGAQDIIKKYRPQLAISIYHSDEDMVEIINYIHNEYPFYKLYVRQYTWFYADTVLYAVR